MSEPLVRFCPLPGCKAKPDGVMCPGHWALISSRVRRELLAELKDLRSKGQRRPSAKAVELIQLAVFEIQMAASERCANG